MAQAPAIPRAPAVPDSPYVGLTHFTAESSPLFFGRERERTIITSNMSASRLTLLYAESGVGKSSLLRAGVAVRLAELAQQRIAAGKATFQLPVVFSSWSGDSVGGLIEAIEETARPFGLKAEIPRDQLENAIEYTTMALGATILIVLDQFEEYFQYHSREAGEGSFADQLARCVNRPDLRANFLISIREDAYAWLGDLFRGRLPNVFANHLHLDYLGREAAEEAIRKPLEWFNDNHVPGGPFEIEDDLAEAVLDGVRHQPTTSANGAAAAPDVIETTYLQLVMQRVWREERAVESRVLRLEMLDHLQGVKVIVETHLNDALGQLPDEQQHAAAGFLGLLVSSTGGKVAWTPEDLARLSRLPQSEIDPVLQRLASPALKVLRPVATPGQLGSTRYEIFHDALARPILAWCDDYTGKQAAARLERERAEKEEAQRQAAEARHRESVERKRKRLAFGALGALFAVVLVGAVVLALVEKNKSDSRLETSQSIESAERASELTSSPGFGPAASALASFVAEDRLHSTFQSRNGILSALQSNPALPRLGVGHGRGVFGVAFQPGSPLVASASGDGTVRLWDSQGHEIGPPLFKGQKSGPADSVAMTASGLLAAGRADGTVDLWNIADTAHPQYLRTLNKGGLAGAQELSVSFSPNGQRLAAGDQQGSIRLWDVSSPDHPARLGKVQTSGGVWSLAFRPTDGAAVLSAGSGGVERWRVTRFGDSKPRKLSSDQARSVAWAPSGLIAYARDDPYEPGIQLMRPSGSDSHFLPTTDLVESVAFVDGGAVLASAGDDSNVTTWDTRSGRQFGPPRPDGMSVLYAVAVSSDGRTIAAGDSSDVVKLWNADGRGSLATTVGSLAHGYSQNEIPSISSLAVGVRAPIAIAAGDGGVVLWSHSTDATGHAPVPLARIRAPASVFGVTYAVAYHGRLLAASFGESFALYNTSGSCPSMPSKACQLGVARSNPYSFDSLRSLDFSRSGRLVATGGEDKTIKIWDVSNPAKPRKVWSRKLGGTVNEVAFSPRTDLLAAAADDGTLTVWNTHNPARPVPLTRRPLIGHGHQQVTSLAFSPDGDLLASGGDDKRIVLWNLKSGIRAETQQGLTQTNSILSLSISPDNKVLAAGDADGSTCLYDIERRAAIGGGVCLLGHISRTGNLSDGVQAVRFDSRGTLYTGGDGNPLVAWNPLLWDESTDKATTQALRTDVCRLTGNGDLNAAQWSSVFVNTKIATSHHGAICEGSQR